MIRFNVITLLCSLSVLQASSTLHSIDKCLTKVEPHSVTPYKESLWDTMSTDARSHVWSFLSVCEQIRARCVAKSFRDSIHPMSNHRLNSEDRLAIDLMKYLEEDYTRDNPEYILVNSYLRENYTGKNLLRKELDITMLKKFPIPFLSNIYEYKRSWTSWLHELSKKQAFIFYKVWGEYNKKISRCKPLYLIEDIFKHHSLVQDYHLIWELMKIKPTDYLTGCFFDNFDCEVNPTIMYQPISQYNICAVKGTLGLLSYTPDLLFYLQEVLDATQIAYLSLNLVHAGDKLFALSLFSYLPTVHDRDSTPELNQDIAYALKKISKDSTSPFYTTSKHTLELFNNRTSYMGCMIAVWTLLYKMRH